MPREEDAGGALHRRPWTQEPARMVFLGRA